MDFSKFREDVDPQEILKLLTWSADGYLHEKQRLGMATDLDELMDKYSIWTTYFKRISYKEEYLQ